MLGLRIGMDRCLMDSPFIVWISLRRSERAKRPTTSYIL